MNRAAIVVTSLAMLVMHCHSLSVEDFEKTVGNTCGVSANDDFEVRADAKENEFPWNVQLFYTVGDKQENNRSICEGTLITPNLVLTTAFCLKSTTLERLSGKLSFVRLGQSDRHSTAFTDIAVEKTIAPDGFNSNGLPQRNNIGLVKLQRNAELSDTIKPICLPLSEALRSRPHPNEEMITTGWGHTETELRATKKQKAKVSAIDSSSCAKEYESFLTNGAISDDQVCAGGNHAYDTCIGQGGAPLMVVDSSTSRWTLVGLTSFGPARCEETGVPGIYTAVGPHINWILDNVEA